jgi:hypothetical protein
MSPFEYVIVLISIILGLGITTILTGVAELIKHIRPATLYAPYIIWILLIFVLHIQEWWVSYRLMEEKTWSLPLFLLIILYPINLYILAHLLFPANLSNAFSSKEFYLDHYPRLFIGSSILVVISLIHNLAYLSLPLIEQIPQVIVLVILVSILISKSKSNAVHTIVSLLLLLTMIFSLAFDRQNLVIR